MSEDYRRTTATDQDGIEAAYRDIVRQIRQQGMDIATHIPDLPQPVEPTTSRSIAVDRARELGLRLYASLTPEQQSAVDCVISHVKDYIQGVWRRPRTVFISGEGGTGLGLDKYATLIAILGKSYCYIVIYHLVRSMNCHVCVMASTGVAATLLPDARTAHKTFSLPVPLEPDSECRISDYNPPAELLEAACFLWDEITAANRFVVVQSAVGVKLNFRYGLEAVDRKMRSLRGQEDFPFGGAVFVTGNVSTV